MYLTVHNYHIMYTTPHFLYLCHNFQVFKKIVKIQPSHVLKKVTVDVQAAIWVAIWEVFSSHDVKIQGCVFHWTQAVWIKVNAMYMATTIIIIITKLIIIIIMIIVIIR